MWNTLIMAPIYNTLIALASLFGGSLALAVIILTLFVKIILLPVSWKAHKAQQLQKKLQPRISKIKEDFPNQTEQTQKIMELYKETGSSPFAGCLPLLIQFPILIGLYRVFYQGVEGGKSLLYSFLAIPDTISYQFLGINLSEKSLLLAIIAGLVQAFQLWRSPSFKNLDPNDPASKISRMMIFVLPVMIIGIGASLPSSLALYFITNSLATYIQELMFTRLSPKN